MERHLERKTPGMTGCMKTLACIGLCLNHSIILAENSRTSQIFDNISNQFSSKSVVKDQQFGEFFLLIIAASVLIFVFWLAYQFYLHRKKTSSPDTAGGIYKRLCQTHNLSLMERHVIRKVSHLNGLDDPLPLFVEPNYLKQILADETMHRYHLTAQSLLGKLFGSGEELLQQVIETENQLPETGSEINVNEISSTNQYEESVNRDSNTDNRNFPTDPFEMPSASSEREKLSPMASRVLLNPIPGRTAFSSLVEPVNRLSSEIAATSIQHNLTDGRGLNERTFDGFGEPRTLKPESLSPMFPRSNVPSPGEMLAEKSRTVNQQSPVSPTPQYLKPHKATSTGIPVKRHQETVAVGK